MGWPEGWVEWATAVQTALTVAAFPIGAMALKYASDQLKKTTAAAEAARDAASDAQNRLIRARLMMHLTLIRQIEADLAESRRDADSKGAIRALRRWRIVSATAAAAISELGSGLGGEIAASNELARIAEQRVEAGVSDVAKATSQAAREISVLTDQLTMAAEDFAVQLNPAALSATESGEVPDVLNVEVPSERPSSDV